MTFLKQNIGKQILVTCISKKKSKRVAYRISDKCGFFAPILSSLINQVMFIDLDITLFETGRVQYHLSHRALILTSEATHPYQRQ